MKLKPLPARAAGVRADSRLSLYAIVAGAAVLAGALAVVSGVPLPVREPARASLILAGGRLVVAVWWVAAALAVRGTAVRFAVWLGAAGAVVGAVAATGVLLGMLGAVPTRVAYVSLAAVSLELPIWSVSLLVWPGSAIRGRGAGVVVAIAIAVLGGGVLFWDFLIRPGGGFPAPTLARMAVLWWALVLLALAVAAVRGSRPEYGAAFGMVLAALGIAFAANYLITILPTPVSRISLWGSVFAVVLRLGAAEALRSGWTDRPLPGKFRAGSVFWPGLAAAGLLAFHLLVAARATAPGPAMMAATIGDPGAVSPVLVPAAVGLVALLVLHEMLEWRRGRR